jgi:hypothetical protein
MKDITLSVPEKDYPFFMKLISQLDFVQVKSSKKKTAKEKFLEELKDAVEEVKLAKQGKIQLKSAEQLLSEL